MPLQTYSGWYALFKPMKTAVSRQVVRATAFLWACFVGLVVAFRSLSVTSRLRANVFGVRPYLQDEYGFGKQEAGDWLTRWMETCVGRHGLEAS